MPMADICLVVHPSSRNEGMRIDSGLAMNSTDPVSEADTIGRSSESSPISETGRPLKVPVHVTDDGERSENGRRKEPFPSNGSMQKQDLSVKEKRNFRSSKRKLSGLHRSGPVLEEEDKGDAGPHSSKSSTVLPQHQRIQEVEPENISYVCTPASLKLKEVLVSRLVEAGKSGRIQVVDLSRRGLVGDDAGAISDMIGSNPQLAVLKLGFNSLGDRGASIIASSCSMNGRFHQSLTVVDLGFNCIGDGGCTAISLNMLAGNHTLRNLFLSGNNFKEKGAMSIAGALLHGCSLTRLHLSANYLGVEGMKVISGAIAEMDKRRQQLLQRSGGIKTTVQPVSLEEIYLTDVKMHDDGIVALSSMLLSNTAIRVLDLGNNDIDDKGLALISQTIARNKGMPLRSLVLSFNKITCAGIECLMNAVWGSKTLKELKLDNNKMQDRGAQLCSVVLGSISLEVLDISFNLVSTVGIKALMKSLSENNSLKSLSLNGIPMDQNASKAVSYALAYNSSLESLSIYSCCIGYSGQRHIVAGVVSNRKVRLQSLTGFLLGPITSTLGLPQVPEDWGNGRVLGFIRFMWFHWHQQSPMSGRQNDARGPAPPTTVAAAGKKAFASLSESDEARVQFQQQQVLQVSELPTIDPDTAILVRSTSGQNLQIPNWGEKLPDPGQDNICNESWSSESDSFDRSSYTESSTNSLSNLASAAKKERRNQNLLWLRGHFHALHDIGNMVFNNADLWQLHQHFFSPAYDITDSPTPDSDAPLERLSEEQKSPIFSPRGKRIERGISFQQLQCAVEAAAREADSSRPNKRVSGEENNEAAPCAKRARNLKPRIAYYPRIREKLESLGTKPSTQTLSLLRQLKYIESMMLQGKNIYVENHESKEHDFPNASDVEMVLLDLL
eukprot:scaffold1203_cov117-Cylindrotheca_fusiformis.AAC.9